jgi:hypothetical protein
MFITTRGNLLVKKCIVCENHRNVFTMPINFEGYYAYTCKSSKCDESALNKLNLVYCERNSCKISQ